MIEITAKVRAAMDKASRREYGTCRGRIYILLTDLSNVSFSDRFPAMVYLGIPENSKAYVSSIISIGCAILIRFCALE